MTTAIELFHRCPYCRRGYGDLYVHTERMIDWLLRFEHYPDEGPTRLETHPARAAIVFNPGTDRPTPCNHLVIATCNTLLYSQAQPKAVNISGLTFDYYHAWFANQGELEDDFSMFLYEYYISDELWRRSSTPAQECSTNRWLAESVRDGRELGLLGNGTSFYASQPEAFFRELSQQYDEWNSGAESQQSEADGTNSLQRADCTLSLIEGS